MRSSKRSLYSLCTWMIAVLSGLPASFAIARAQSASTLATVGVRRHLDASPAGTPLPAGTSAVLVDLASRATVIFAGQVLSVTPFGGTVDIRFGVESPVRNCPQNGDYVLREWAGLWTAHPNRYRIGQRVLLFLTARGPAGLSAPVDVNDGIVPLVPTAQPPIADASGMAPADTPSAGFTVDLRWLQTHVVRTSGTPALLNSLSTASSTMRAWSGPVAPLAPISATSLNSVLAVIGNKGSNAQP